MTQVRAKTIIQSFDQVLIDRLEAFRAQGLLRQLRRIESPQSSHIRVDNKKLINFSSNDYLGLANHPRLKTAAIDAIRRYGAGAGASRLVCGSLQPHHDLEEAIAAFKSTKAALSFSSGYTAAIGVICALMGKEDHIIMDELIHASIIDAARLSGATLHIFPHNDLNALENHLHKVRRSYFTRKGRTLASGRGSLKAKRTPSPSGFTVQVSRPPLIITESIFSMEGDRAPLKEIVDLKERYGAYLMLDEAHATGLYGSHRRGIAEDLGLGDRIEIQMGTLGKAIGAGGGYICGSRTLIDFLINRARSFIFSTAPVPAAAAAAIAGLNLVQSAEGANRRLSLWQRIDALPASIDSHATYLRSPIIPILIGNEAMAVRISAELRRCGIFIPAIRYPSVARGKARLRLTLSAAHSAEDVRKLVTAFTATDFRCLPNP